MLDYLKNHVEVGDTVIIALKQGRTAGLSRGWILDSALKPQFAGGTPTNMIEVQWSNLHKFWIPASKVVGIPHSMLPEKRKEQLNETEEGIEVS